MIQAQRVIRIEPLEARRLLAATLTQSIADLALAEGASPTQIVLNQHFADPDITGTLIVIDTNLGDIPIELFDTDRPITVQNFLEYADNHRYDNAIFNRARPGFVLQGGGFKHVGNTLDPDAPQYQLDTVTKTDDDPTPDPIPLEIDPLISNMTGTIAMARSTAPDSATSAFYINLADNTDLDTANGGYSVFGRVVGTGMQTVAAIMNLPRFNANDLYGLPGSSEAFAALPLQNLPSGELPVRDNFVLIEGTSRRDVLTFSASSSNTLLVTPTIQDGVLTLNYAPGVQGLAEITVQAADISGNVITETFTVQVGDAVDVSIGAGAAKSVTWRDSDGTRATLELKKGGTALISFAGDGITQTTKSGRVTIEGSNVSVVSIVMDGTTSKSELKLSSSGGNKRVTLGNISSTGALSKLGLKTGDISGDIGISGNISKAELASMSAGTLTASTIKELKVADGFGADLNASQLGKAKLDGVSGGTWIIVTSGGTIEARSIGSDWNASFAGTVSKLKTKGDFAGNLTAHTLKTLEVGGAIIGGTLTLTRTTGEGGRAIDKLKVKRQIVNFQLRSNGHVGSIEASSTSSSTFYAGVAPISGKVPTTIDDYFAAASIKSFKLKSKSAGAFWDAVIGAPIIGKVDLGKVAFDNLGEAFGIGADRISELKMANNAGKKKTLKRLDDPAAIAGIFSANKITPGDFVIALL